MYLLSLSATNSYSIADAATSIVTHDILHVVKEYVSWVDVDDLGEVDVVGFRQSDDGSSWSTVCSSWRRQEYVA